MSGVDESSDNSEYLDFQSPSARSEASGELDWDHHEEQLSFAASPNSAEQSPPAEARGRVRQFRFGSNPEDPDSLWPPSQPHSETDHNILEDVAIRGPGDQILEDIEGFETNLVDDVFQGSGLEDLTKIEMPPKKKTPEELYAAFETGMQTWQNGNKRM